MRAHLTSLLRFRNMLPAIWMACAIWLAWYSYEHGQGTVAYWLVGGTAVYTAAFSYLVRRRQNGRFMRWGVIIPCAVIAGLVTGLFPMAVLSMAFPKLAGGVVNDIIYGGLLMLYAIGIWFSSVWRRWDVRLEHGLTMLACNMAEECISLPDDMTERAVGATRGNIAYMLVEQWQFILCAASALLGITLASTMLLTDSIFWAGALVAFGSQLAWLVRCMDRVESAVCEAVSA